MKLKTIFAVILIMLLRLPISAEMIQRHLLTLPKNNNLAIGIHSKIWNSIAMEESLLQQAAVLFTRLDGTFAVEKYLLDQQNNNSSSAHYQYTVVSDIELLDYNYKNLKFINNQEIYGSIIAFFSLQDQQTKYTFSVSSKDVFAEKWGVNITKNDTLVYGISKSSRIETAFEEAFENALIEYSKYICQNIKTLYKVDDDNSVLVMENTAINMINHLEFSKIQIEILKDSKTLEYKVYIELRKES